MCGIAGVFDSTGPPSEETLEAISECLVHRGPDDGGIFVDGPVTLTHRRLAIIDPETGDQPLFNEDETISVVFNGEIYNYLSLRDSLSNAGHNFETRTDTEILVHLYEERGLDFVELLEGMFAFALWDANKERLILARDPMGIKPLLLADDGERIAFASELPALFEAGVDHGGIDTKSITQYFGLGYIPAPRTALRNVRKLRPGEIVVISEEGIDHSDFYTPSVDPIDVSFDEAVAAVRTRVEEAVEKRQMSDVPLGAFLSGGIDSSIVVGLMANLSESPVQTFTVGFDESLFDESWAAREVADYHDTDHTEFTVTPEDVQSAIPVVLDRLGEPFADASIIPTYVVSRETSRDVKVALSGDGADELFAGYSRYRGEQYSKYYRRVPRPVRTQLIEPAINEVGVDRDTKRGELVRKAQKFVRGGNPDVVDRHFEWARIFHEDAISAFEGIDLVKEGRASLGREHERATSYLPGNRQDDLSRIQAVDTHFGLPNQILHKTDLASMYNSLEVRVPFLDTEVVEYAMSLPTDYKITPRKQKRVLKRAFEDVLPRSILQRNKQGFDMPIGEWFKNELEADFREMVNAVDTDLLDRGEVMNLFEDHKRGNSAHGKFLWSVYVFAYWHRRMEREGII